MAKGNLFWHVPEWFGGGPASSLGVDNVDQDIFVQLVDTEDVAALGQDNFIVERIIGQYLIVSDAVAPADRFLHHRIYVTMADLTTVNLRTLNTADDADTSFMYHKVELFTVQMAGTPRGTWSSDTAGFSARESNARLGMFDIRVGRRVREGESLIWHTMIVPTPTSDEWHLQMWVRVLLKEA